MASGEGGGGVCNGQDVHILFIKYPQLEPNVFLITLM